MPITVQPDFVLDLTRHSGNTTLVDADKQMFLTDGFNWIMNHDDSILSEFEVTNDFQIKRILAPNDEPKAAKRLVIIAAAMLAMMERFEAAIASFEWISSTIKDAEKTVSLDRGQVIRSNIVDRAEKKLLTILSQFSTNALVEVVTGPIAFGTMTPEIFFEQTFFDAHRIYTMNREAEDVL